MADLKNRTIEVARSICEIVDGYRGDGIGLIVTRYPDLSRSALERLELIGRGKLLPQFALDASVAAQRIANLPTATQTMILRDGVEVLKAGGVVRKPYQSLTYAEVSQSFTATGLRSIEEQKKFVKQQWRPAYKQRYEINDELAVVVLKEDCQFTVLELEQLLTQLKAVELKNLQKNMQAKQAISRER